MPCEARKCTGEFAGQDQLPECFVAQKKVRLLIVEHDSALMRAMTRFFGNQEGIQASFSGSWEDAKEKAGRESPDVAVCSRNHMENDRSHVDFLNFVRKESPDTKVILFSSSFENSDSSVGFDRLVQRPCENRELARIIEQLSGAQ